MRPATAHYLMLLNEFEAGFRLKLCTRATASQQAREPDLLGYVQRRIPVYLRSDGEVSGLFGEGTENARRTT